VSQANWLGPKIDDCFQGFNRNFRDAGFFMDGRKLEAQKFLLGLKCTYRVNCIV